jgi:hypothetical protein
MLSIYEGQRCIGFLLNRGRTGWEAFDADEVSLGIFPTQQAASDAINARLEGKPRKQGGRR